MKKINGFTITKLSMTGFKCFEDMSTFHFGDITYISGSNGQGKSSIADAIAFAFMGTPFFGDRGLDRLQNKNMQAMTVSVGFIDSTGNTHNLTRTRKHDTTTISYDDLNIRQADLNEAFGDKDIFLSILNPLYFINILGDKGKNLLEKLLPVVKHGEVLAALPEYSQEILANQHLSSPETFIKNRRGELKELEESLIGYRSQQKLLAYQREERESSLYELHSSIEKIVGEMEELVRIRDNNRDFLTEESTLVELRKKRSELLSAAAQNDIEKAIQVIFNEIRVVEKNIAIQNASSYISPYASQIADAEAGLKSLYDEHMRISKALAGMTIGYKCFTCAVMITVENINAVKTDLQHRLSALVNDGKNIKNHLAEIKVKDTAVRRKFDEHKVTALEEEHNKLDALNRQLQEVNVSRELDKEDCSERILILENQINEQEYRIANGNLTREQTMQLSELERLKKECEVRVEALNGIFDYDYATLIAETEAEIVRLRRLINEAINYAAKRIELMLDGLKMSKAEIVLTEIIKTTGEIKDCFRFNYDGRDYRCLSLSEKILAGLEVSTLIQRLSERYYPVFIDNGESISSLSNFSLCGQVIYSRVTRNQVLQVTHKKYEQIKTAS